MRFMFKFHSIHQELSARMLGIMLSDQDMVLRKFARGTCWHVFLRLSEGRLQATGIRIERIA